MKQPILTISALLASATAAQAVGLDRSARPVGLIFESGNVLEFSAGFANPSVSGTDLLGAGSGNIADDFSLLGAGFRYQVNDKFSFGVLIDEPYGADILYGPGSPLLAGTAAEVDSVAATLFGRYRIDDNWSVHGGLVYQSVEASVTLAGAAFNASGLNGYRADFDDDSALGYTVGVAYEIPDIALRVALTYHSEIDHTLDTTQTFGGVVASAPTTTEVTTPESVRLDFQSGVAENTLVFGHLRFSHYSVTDVRPSLLGGASLTDLENAWDASIGVGRRFNDKWSGSVSIGWEEKGEDDFVSPLSATNGAVFIALGASYQATDQIEISGGLRYTDLGDAFASPGGTPVAEFTSNDAISAGLRVRFRF